VTELERVAVQRGARTRRVASSVTMIRCSPDWRVVAGEMVCSGADTRRVWYPPRS
jgi:hypothetical protein